MVIDSLNINLVFNLKYDKNIFCAFSSTNLGSIKTNGSDKPTVQKIKNKLDKLIDNRSRTTITNVNINNITDTSADISYKYITHTGTFTVTFKCIN